MTSGGGETTRLGKSSGKSYGRSYGSTQKSVKETFIVHDVSSSDTLQGISLKYGVTTRGIGGEGEQIQDLRRVNKLYTNDSIFLRSVLYIPVGEQPLPASVLENTVSSSHGSPLNDRLSKTANGQEDQDEKEKSDDTGEKNPLDYLSRIDEQIKQTRRVLEKVEKESSVGEMDPGASSFSSPHRTQEGEGESSRVSPVLGQDESYQLGQDKSVDVHPPPEAKYRERDGSLSPILGETTM